MVFIQFISSTSKLERVINHICMYVPTYICDTTWFYIGHSFKITRATKSILSRKWNTTIGETGIVYNKKKKTVTCSRTSKESKFYSYAVRNILRKILIYIYYFVAKLNFNTSLYWSECKFSALLPQYFYIFLRYHFVSFSAIRKKFCIFILSMPYMY